jgi:hypothetical protein
MLGVSYRVDHTYVFLKRKKHDHILVNAQMMCIARRNYGTLSAAKVLPMPGLEKKTRIWTQKKAPRGLVTHKF